MNWPNGFLYGPEDKRLSRWFVSKLLVVGVEAPDFIFYCNLLRELVQDNHSKTRLSCKVNYMNMLRMKSKSLGRDRYDKIGVLSQD
jgi:hypothetical protein